MTSQGRIAAFTVFIVALVTLIARFMLRLEESTGPIDALSYMSQYFTLLTNFLVMVTMGLLAAGAKLHPGVVRAVVVAIAGVGIVYHTLLAHLVTLSGWELLADHGTHTVVPILSVIWWIAFGAHEKLSLADPVRWITWPLVYCIYILIRANFSGFYPYPFLNISDLGWAATALNIVGLTVFFMLLGYVLALIERLRKPTLSSDS